MIARIVYLTTAIGFGAVAGRDLAAGDWFNCAWDVAGVALFVWCYEAAKPARLAEAATDAPAEARPDARDAEEASDVVERRHARGALTLVLDEQSQTLRDHPLAD